MKKLMFLKEYFNKHRKSLILLSLFCIPLKLSWTYIVLLPTLLLWIGFFPKELKTSYENARPISSLFLFFIIVSICTSFFGLSPFSSIIELLRLLFVSCTALLISHHVRTQEKTGYVIIIVAAQAIAALHTVLDLGIINGIPRLFHGAVTESGQIALTLPLSLFLLLQHQEPEGRRKGWHIAFSLVAIVLLVAALFLNMKRGPIAGVFLAGIVFATMYSWKLFVPLIGTGLVSFFCFDQLRERILYSPSHFFIAGGRGEIWSVGGELMQRYPLGIGFQNSQFLQQFSQDIPSELEHFHSNFLNIAVETGWIGLFLYLCLFFFLFRAFFATPKKDMLLKLSALCAVLSWQIAGLVEYNFGDSEVFLLAMAITGIFLSTYQSLRTGNST